MKRIAIVGGGIAGVSAAYELACQQRAGASVEFVLFEASQRLGGTVETERRGNFIIECGPDSWVTEKPWARELAVELGLETEIILSRDECRKAYLAEDNTLRVIPEGMRMMVPVELAGVLNSPLFSEQAKLDYQREPKLAEELKATALDRSAPPRDESVREFVIRHFGAEVADTIAAPLLAGVLGGDIATLSARAVLPAYVALEREYGSLILGLQDRKQSGAANAPIFSTLRNGLSGLIEAMESNIPAPAICRGFTVQGLERLDHCWRVHGMSHGRKSSQDFDSIVIATPAEVSANLLAPIDRNMEGLFPQHSSSAIVVAFAFSAAQSKSLQIPPGFGFLVPQRTRTGSTDTPQAAAQRALLACTFMDQKFPDRVPAGAVLLRAFFGGPDVLPLLKEGDAALEAWTHRGLEKILGKLPEPEFAVVRRWPDSLPLYAVGHLERIRELETRLAEFPHIRLIGNAYRGVGLPDLVRDGRSAARKVIASLAGAKPGSTA